MIHYKLQVVFYIPGGITTTLTLQGKQFNIHSKLIGDYYVSVSDNGCFAIHMLLIIHYYH